MSLFLNALGTVLSSMPTLAGTAFAGLYMNDVATGAKTILSGNFKSSKDEDDIIYYKERVKIGKASKNEVKELSRLLEKTGKGKEALNTRIAHGVASYDDAKKWASETTSFTEEELSNYLMTNYPDEYTAELKAAGYL